MCVYIDVLIYLFMQFFSFGLFPLTNLNLDCKNGHPRMMFNNIDDPYIFTDQIYRFPRKDSYYVSRLSPPCKYLFSFSQISICRNAMNVSRFLSVQIQIFLDYRNGKTFGIQFTSMLTFLTFHLLSEENMIRMTQIAGRTQNLTELGPFGKLLWQTGPVLLLIFLF